MFSFLVLFITFFIFVTSEKECYNQIESLESLDISISSLLQNQSETMDGFWRLTENVKLDQKSRDHALFNQLEMTDLESLRYVLYSYRFFVKYYIKDLIILVNKLPFLSQIQCSFSEILYEELGNGYADNSHLNLYDAFLNDMDVNHITESNLTSKNDVLLTEISDLVNNNDCNIELVLGLRGMGAECLCQVYLTQLYNTFIKNNAFIEFSQNNDIDWRFWNVHAKDDGEDREHMDMMKNMISDIFENEENNQKDLIIGYKLGSLFFQQFWTNIFNDIQIY